MNIWKVYNQSGSSFHYNTSTGILNINEPGFYSIHSQMIYYNRAPQNSYKIWKIEFTEKGKRVRELSACVESQAHNVFLINNKEYEAEKFQTKRGYKKISLSIREHYVTCNTDTIEFLNQGDLLVMATPYSNRKPVEEKYNTFWGVRKLK